MKRLFYCTPLLLFLLYPGALYSSEIMPLAEVKPGMRGVGKTVFAGTDIEQFEFEVLEIIPNFKPKRDVILVKLLGDKVEHTGVAFGMSGSPMYIDGKLIGALAYMMTIFAKEPIAGITPVEEMLEIFEQEKVRAQELASNRGFNPDFLEMAVGAAPISWEKFVPPHLQNKSMTSNFASGLKPLTMPLVFSGFDPSVLEFSNDLFAGQDLEIIRGGGTAATSEPPDGTAFEAGGPYSVVLVDGDLGLHATGTVTLVENDKVLGMGHPFFNSGAVALPMGEAKILTTLSSLMSSTKIAALTRVAGTVHQDRTTGIMGIRGETPGMIPFRLTFNPRFQEPVEFHFRLAEDRSLHSLTPLISNLVLTSALESARLSLGSQTLKLDGQISLKNAEPIPLENYYAGSVSSSFITDAVEATSEISAILGALLSNNFELPEIESVELNFEALHRKYVATVEGIDVNKTVVKPGEEVVLTVHLREYQGAAHQIRHVLTLPEEIEARRVGIFAGSGSLLTQLERRIHPKKFDPKSFEHLLEILNSRRRNNFVFFQMRLRDQGLLVEGQELPNLPPSVYSIMNAQRSTGNASTLRDRVLVEDQVEVEYSVSGGKTLWLNIKPN